MAKKEKKQITLLICWARSPWRTRCILAKNHKGVFHGDKDAKLWT